MRVEFYTRLNFPTVVLIKDCLRSHHVKLLKFIYFKLAQFSMKPFVRVLYRQSIINIALSFA